MAVGVIALLAGIVSVLLLPVMPARSVGPAVFATGIAAMAAGRRVPAAFLAGAGMALMQAGASLGDRLEAGRSGEDRVVEGRVEKLLSRHHERASFLFAPREQDRPADVPRRLRLTWYGADEPPAAGESWRLRVRLREPRGLANPGGFDYERWLLAEGIGATGYVRRDPGNGRLAPAGGWPEPVRRTLAESIAAAVGSARAAAVLTALVAGQRGGLTSEVREKMLASGTAHLLAISGLHVGIAAGTGAAVGRMLWVLAPGIVTRTALAQSSVLAIAVASAYAAIAGPSTATQRALAMVVCMVVFALARRTMPMARGLVVAALLILIADPLTPLQGGFWLSFVAVTILVLRFAGQVRPDPKVATLVVAQVALGLGMLVPGVSLFGFIPTAGPLVNLFAVPLVSLVVLPLGLLGGLLSFLVPEVARWPLAAAGAGLEGLFVAVDHVLAAAPRPIEPAMPPVPVMAGAALAGVMLLLPAGLPGRRFAPALLIPLLFWQPTALRAGEFELTVIDVGQGLSVLVRTRRHALLYDAGAAWPGGDAGASTIRPLLRSAGVGRIDMLIISHGDLDHAGGAASIAPLLAGPVLVGPGTSWPNGPAQVCQDGQGWTWDGVRFRVLHPSAGSRFRRNNASCVLRVSAEAGSALITGDIESAAERALVRRHERLQADIVIAPHHGSATSSGIDLVGATRPRWVVFAAGYRNRWGFPRPEVKRRWQAVGAVPLGTADSGAISFRFAPETGVIGPVRWRCVSRRFWRAADCGPDSPAAR